MDIFKAAETDDLVSVQHCVSEGIDINSTDRWGRSALYIGCQHNGIHVVEYLLDNGANAELRENVHQSTAVIMAAQYGYSDIVKMLLNQGVNINTQDKYGQTALWIASCNGHENTVDILLANKADPDIRKHEKQSTALHMACQNNHAEMVRLLLKYNAKIDMKEKDGRTGLYIAACEGHEKTVTLLLQHRADVNVCRNNGTTPLFVAAQEGHAAVVDMLLDHGANTESRHVSGATPMIIACFYKHPAVVEILCKRGADINATMIDGDTALHRTAQENSPDTTRVLLKYKPELTSNKAGQTALEIAKEKQYKDLALLLEDYSKKSRNRSACPDESTTNHAERSQSSVNDYLDSLQSELKDKKNLVQAHGGASDVAKINDYEVILCKMLRRADVTEEAQDDGAAAAAAASDEIESPLWSDPRPLSEEATKLPILGNDEKDFGNSHMFVIAEKLGDQWKRLAASLGMDFQKIERIWKDNSSDQVYAAWVMLVQWRDSVEVSMFEKRQMLLRAVGKMKRPDIQELI